MRTFDIDGTKYVHINGKSFYLLRGYRVGYEKWAMVQVFGTAPLTKDDLPEKNWNVIAAKTKQGRVFTAWKPSYFDGTNEKRLFVAATAHASLRLLIDTHVSSPLADRAFALLTHPSSDLLYRASIDATTDEGNAGVPAYSVSSTYTFNNWIKQLQENAA
jgi:hypothetical protein